MPLLMKGLMVLSLLSGVGCGGIGLWLAWLCVTTPQSRALGLIVGGLSALLIAAPILSWRLLPPEQVGLRAGLALAVLIGAPLLLSGLFVVIEVSARP